jgi:phosphatidate cytidylyltransferase
VLRQRVFTALVLVAVLLGVVVWLPPVATVVLVSLLVLVGAWEWAAFIRADSTALRLGYVVVVGLLCAAGWRFIADDSFMRVVMLVATAWWFVAFLWVALAPAKVSAAGAALAGLLALVPCWLALVFFATRMTPRAGWVLFSLALVWAADTGAFFAGKFFGRVPLAPRVSPKKTWEGVLGGLVLSGAVAAVCGPWLGASGFAFISLCVAVAALSVVGDLTESLLKRASGLKDSGSLFPGHGGMLDRIDSVTAAAPALVFGLYGLGLVR